MAENAKDEYWMAVALAEARAAAAVGEVPVGAVIVQNEQVLARGCNGKEAGDPTAHAEIVAIRAAAQALGDWRLENCALYVTLEPCLMCAGAVIQARLARVIYGAVDLKFGAVVSKLDAFAPAWNHRPQVSGGVLADDCAAELKRFFAARRQKDENIARLAAK